MSGARSLAGIVLAAAVRWRPARADAAAAAVALAFVPLALAVAVRGAAWIEGARATRLAAEARPRLAATAAVRQAEGVRATLAPAFGRPTLTGLAERLATALPADARVVALADDPEAGLRLTIETADPDAIAPALAADPLLGRLRRTGQAPARGEGVALHFGVPR